MLFRSMMLRHTFGLSREAECAEAGVMSALKGGMRTTDLARDGERTVTTDEMGDKIAEFVRLAANASAHAAR